MVVRFAPHFVLEAHSHSLTTLSLMWSSSLLLGLSLLLLAAAGLFPFQQAVGVAVLGGLEDRRGPGTTEVWSTDLIAFLPTQLFVSPLASKGADADNLFLFGSLLSGGDSCTFQTRVKALNLSTGSIDWSHSPFVCGTTFAQEFPNVAITSKTLGGVVGFKIDPVGYGTLTQTWKVPYPDGTWYVHSMFTVGGALYWVTTTLDDGTITRIDPVSGAYKYSAPLEVLAGFNMLTADSRRLYVVSRNTLTAFSASEVVSVLWSVTAANTSINTIATSTSSNLILTLFFNNSFSVLEASSGRWLWTHTGSHLSIDMPSFSDNGVVTILQHGSSPSDSLLTGLDALTGRELWSVFPGIFYTSSNFDHNCVVSGLFVMLVNALGSFQYELVGFDTRSGSKVLNHPVKLNNSTDPYATSKAQLRCKNIGDTQTPTAFVSISDMSSSNSGRWFTTLKRITLL